jgi:hypothetical protein
MLAVVAVQLILYQAQQVLLAQVVQVGGEMAL